MENLPIELLDSILDHCWVTDIQNLACCSRDHNVLVKPILWRDVTIPLSSLSSKLEPFVENLQHTTHLTIKDDFQKTQEEENSEVSSTRRKSIDIGLNLAELLSNCCPTKIVSLDSRLNGVSLDYILNRFRCLKTLKLLLDDDIHTGAINELSELEDLRVFYPRSQSSITDVSFWYLVNGEKFKKFHLHFLTQFSDEVLVPIAKWTSLEYLKISDNKIKEDLTLLDVSPLSALANLTSLELCNIIIRDDDLKLLCRCLKKLETLTLRRSQFTDDGLSEIHCLESLTSLDLGLCGEITPACFQHMVSLPLRSIEFSASICSVPGGSKIPNEDVSALNKLATLRKVCVYSHHSKSGRSNLAVVTSSLCCDEPWKLKVDLYMMSKMRCTLTR